MLSPLPLGPEELERLDIQMARQDPRHRCKQIEERLKALWWRISRRFVAKRKGLSERERQRRRENVGLQRREK